jgi:hypothetical protein
MGSAAKKKAPVALAEASTASAPEAAPQVKAPRAQKNENHLIADVVTKIGAVERRLTDDGRRRLKAILKELYLA